MGRVNQAEHVIRILVAASQEYVNTYSTRMIKGKCTGRGVTGNELCGERTGNTNEQALVCLSDREIVDASRGCTFHCKMANNRFFL